MLFFRKLSILMMIATALYSVRIFAQSANATLSGFIRDVSGALVPNATVTVESLGTQIKYTAKTGDSGGYSVVNLPVGDYKVTTEAAGFKMAVVPKITLQTAQIASLDLKMEIGAVTEAVVVTDTVPQLQTADSSIGQIVEARSIESIALNGRQFWQLVALTPGATYTPGGESTRTGGSSIRSSAVNVQINGTGFIYNGWALDGVDITEYEQGGTNVQPNVDALAEFKVLGANMPAAYGHTPNVVTASMKSGTNAFHGVLFEFIRNDVADAHNYFARSSKNILKRNQFGGTISGPIKRDKVFFFADYEQTRQSQGVVFNDILPTDLMRTGNFTGKTIHQPGTTNTPFPGNMVPISPQAAYFLKFMPTQAQGAFSAAQSLVINKGDIKIDAALTSKDHLMGRYSVEDNNEQDPNQYPSLGKQPLVSRAQNYAVTEAHSFGSHFLNEAKFGLYKDIFLFGAVLPGTNYDGNASISGFEQVQQTPSFPLISLSGYSGFNGSGSNSLPKSNRIRTWQYGDAVSYTSGRHTVQAGYTLYHQRHAFFNGQSQEGQFSFTTMYTGDAFADFLLGFPASVFRAFPISLYGNIANQHAAYIQDDWRPMDHLTINAGLRYEYNPFFDGLNGQTSAFDYNTGKVIIPSRNHNPLVPLAQPEIPQVLPLFRDRLEYSEDLGLPQSLRTTGPGQFVPRFGFSYGVGSQEKTVIRGAYGIFPIYFDTNLSLQWAKVPPFELTQTVTNTAVTTAGGAPSFNWADPFNGQAIVSANPSPGSPCTYSYKSGTNTLSYQTANYLSCVQPNVYSAPTKLQHTYMHQFSLAVQRELAKNLTLDVAYVGNRTVHQQLISVPDNVPVPASTASTTLPVQARRPYAQWSQFFMGETNGTANYNALQAKVEKRYSSGFQMLASYAYSKCLDNGTNQSAPIALSLLPRAYAECDINLKHVLTISSVYTLPFGHGHYLLGHSNAVVNGALGGWEIAGIYTARSGLPFTPVLSSDVANNGTSGQWPNRIASGKLSNPTIAKWFDPAAFSSPASGTYGSSGRNILHGDGLVNLDMTLKKNFNFTATRFLELRLEAFNVANHPTFNTPNATIGSSAAGTVTSTLTANRIMQAAVKIFF